jgi:hypothetical protein
LQDRPAWARKRAGRGESGPLLPRKSGRFYSGLVVRPASGRRTEDRMSALGQPEGGDCRAGNHLAADARAADRPRLRRLGSCGCRRPPDRGHRPRFDAGGRWDRRGQAKEIDTPPWAGYIRGWCRVLDAEAEEVTRERRHGTAGLASCGRPSQWQGGGKNVAEHADWWWAIWSGSQVTSLSIAVMRLPNLLATGQAYTRCTEQRALLRRTGPQA